jgi:hypothetical protein
MALGEPMTFAAPHRVFSAHGRSGSQAAYRAAKEHRGTSIVRKPLSSTPEIGVAFSEGNH